MVSRSPRRLTLTALIALSPALISSPFAANDSIQLRYRLRPGAAYGGAMTISLTTQVTMEGLPEEAAALAQAIGRDLKQQITIKTVLDVGQAEKDGSLPVEYRIVDGQVQMTMAGQPIEVPGVKDALSKNRTIKGKLGSQGRKLEVDPATFENVPGLPPDTAQRIAQAMPELPDGELKVGDSFEVPVKMSLPGLPMAGRVETASKCVYTLKSYGDDIAVFDTITIVSGSYGDDGTERLKMRVTGGGEGKAVFDLKEGIFTDSSTSLKVNMAMEMPYPTGPDPVPENEAAEPKIVKITATIEGPADYRMSRTPSVK